MSASETKSNIWKVIYTAVDMNKEINYITIYNAELPDILKLIEIKKE